MEDVAGHVGSTYNMKAPSLLQDTPLTKSLGFSY